MAHITKGEMWDLLGDSALAFASFLLTPEGAALKVMLDNTTGIGLDSPLIQKQLLPLLLKTGIIDPAVMDRINARNAAGADLSGMRHFRVPIPAEVQDVARWISGYCTADHYVTIQAGMAWVDTQGNCLAPGAQEVT